MALVKNQIWSPEELNSLGGFRPFVPGEECASVPSISGSSESSHPRGSEFPDYAELLIRDPEVKAKLDSWVESEVNKRLFTLLSKYKDEGLAGEHLSGESRVSVTDQIDLLEEELTAKWNRRKEELVQQEKVWIELMSEWAQQKESLLRNHETRWCQTMGHLLRQFQVANSNGILTALEEWMATSIPDFLEKSEVVVHLSKADFEKIKGSQNELRGSHWVMQADPDLKSGQIRLEAGNAGVIFDTLKSFEKLNRFLECET